MLAGLLLKGWYSHCESVAGGMVNKIGPDYIGLLVLGVFNAAIGRQNIRSDLQYKVQVSASSSVTVALHTMSVVLWKCSGCKGQSPS